MADLPVRLQPGAASDRIDGWGVDAEGRPVLKVRVRARPVDGQANAALIALLAGALGAPRSSIAVARGGQSRLKMVRIDGLDPADLSARLQGIAPRG